MSEREGLTIEAAADRPGAYVNVSAVIGRLVTLEVGHRDEVGTPDFVYLTANEARQVADALRREARVTGAPSESEKAE